MTAAPIMFTILGDRHLIERFERIAEPEPMSGCWLWSGAPGDSSKTGQYGRFRINGPQEKAHRASWLLYRGDIPDGLHVLHSCDNPACVNPHHLFLGTNLDNVMDRVSKGRSGWESRPGEAHPMSRLTEADVRSIRTRYAAGTRGRALAKEYGVNPATVSEIITRRKWKHVQ